MTSTTETPLSERAWTTRAETPDPNAVVCEGWVRVVNLVRDLAAEVDPRRLSTTERLAILAAAPHLAEPIAVARFVAYANAEQELSTIAEDDYSAEAAIRRGELGDDCARLIRELIGGHPFAPGAPHVYRPGGYAPDPFYVADQLAELRADRDDLRASLVRERQKTADLAVANESMETLVDALRSAGAPDPAYNLTSAGLDATGGRVIALPLPDQDDAEPAPAPAPHVATPGSWRQR